MTAYSGPLFYPPVGQIAVTKAGSRIEVWPDESDSADCFTGLILLSGRTHTQTVVFDLSCMWDRLQIDHIEDPTDDDRRIILAAGLSSMTAHLTDLERLSGGERL